MTREAKARTRLLAALTFALSLLLAGIVPTYGAVVDDPLVRMPGTQPGQVALEDPGRCLNCHEDAAFPELPGFNWKGSMMAQAARDFLYWSCLTVGAQDAVWAVGSPDATDICLRCHMSKGWLEGRSDPTNGSAMLGADFDGVQCDFCHRMYDPFFETTYGGTREGSDWAGYWDEGTSLSGSLALATYTEDATISGIIRLFNGGSFFTNNLPPANYVENGSGQYFVSQNSDKRASFADANAKHRMFYSRYHKSKYFCSTCHDVSNPVLQNLGADPAQPLPTETESAFSYYHVERTFSEFMLSDYGRQGGAPGIGPFAPGVFDTSLPGDYIGKCQDCHMRDVSGYGCNKAGSPLRPSGSAEHPQSGAPLHDLTGGNAFVSYVLASVIPGSPNYDAVNDQLLHQGPAVLTLDLTQGLGVNPAALLAGVDRAKEQLQLAASIEGASFENGTLTFRIQNRTGHKLISGFPEGRRMFVNIKAYDSAGVLVHEINPYDYTAGTLKGLSDLAPLGPLEEYVDELVYEMHPTSSLTGETETFHFVLATGRYKDNRIPPIGFRLNEAAARLAEPVWHGVSDAPGGANNYFTADEYAGGYDAVSVTTLPANTASVQIDLYYQTTSREYMEFLRDEINGTGSLTLPAGAYIAQSDPFFTRLKAWGNTLWQLWTHNMNVPGAAPFLMAQATVGTPPGGGGTQCDTPATPEGVSATALQGRKIQVSWSPVSPLTGGYNVYYDTGGKLQFIASVPAGATTYTDTGLSRGNTYCYVVTAWNDCDGSGTFTSGSDTESTPSSPPACATAK